MPAPGATPIIIYHTTTASAQPSTANLNVGELAINVTDKKVYSKDGSNALITVVGTLGNQEASSVAITGGSINGTSIGAATASTGRFSDLTDTGLTSGRITYASTGGNLVDSANLTFNGTILTSTGFSGPLNGTVGATTPAAGTFTSLTDSGNLTFTGTGNRITGDFSNATIANRVAFQTNLTNGSTTILAIPNGTGSTSQLLLRSSSTATDDSFGQVVIVGGSDFRLASGASGTGTFLPMTFYTNNTERMRIDSSGNVGIGTSSPTYRLQVQSGSSTILAGADSGATTLTNDTQKVMRFGVPHYTNAEEPVCGLFVSNESTVSTVLIGGGTGLFNAATSLQFYTAANNTTTGGSERMRINAGGDVGIGTSSPGSKLDVNGQGLFRGLANRNTATAGTGFTYFDMGIDSDGAVRTAMASSFSGTSSTLEFSTAISGTRAERMRISAGGNLLVGTTSVNDFRLAVTGNFTNNAGLAAFRNDATSGITYDQLQIQTGQGASTAFFSQRTYAGGVSQFAVRGDGVIFAQNTAVQSISDGRVKENVRDADEGLDIILDLRPVRFDFKEGFGNNRKNQLGFIAQEVETAFADAVDTTSEKDENGDFYKSVGQGALIPVLVKAIQELNAKVTALEAQLNKE
jgi:hypothetical protein